MQGATPASARVKVHCLMNCSVLKMKYWQLFTGVFDAHRERATGAQVDRLLWRLCAGLLEHSQVLIAAPVPSNLITVPLSRAPITSITLLLAK